MDKNWTAEDEAKLAEALARKAASAAAESERFEELFEDIPRNDEYWGLTSVTDIAPYLRRHADAVCELLAPYRKDAP